MSGSSEDASFFPSEKNVVEEVVTPPKKRRLGGSYCVAPFCNHNQLRDKDFKFFKFPKKNKTQMELWTKALSRSNPDGSPWSPRPSSRLCSAHFVSGQWSRTKSDPDYVPSLFHPSFPCPRGFFNRKRGRRCLLLRVRSTQSQTDSSLVSNESFLFSCSFHPSTNSACTQISSSVTQMVSSYTETHHRPLLNTGTLTEEPAGLLKVDSFSNVKLKALTGIASNLFNTLLYNLSEALKPSLRLSKRNKILMFLVRLRLGLSFTVLSGFFGVTQKVAKFCFEEVMEVLYRFSVSALTWCSKQEIKDRMPEKLKASFPKARILLHFYECQAERRSKHQAEGRRREHSLKFLFGLAPHGEITFVSEAFHGSISDLDVLKSSGIVDILDPGDVVLSVDRLRGNEEYFRNRDLELIVLPPKGLKLHKCHSKEEFEEHSRLVSASSVYSNIENMIKKLKTFKFTSYVNRHMFLHLNKLIVITGFLCNDTPSIIVNE